MRGGQGLKSLPVGVWVHRGSDPTLDVAGDAEGEASAISAIRSNEVKLPVLVGDRPLLSHETPGRCRLSEAAVAVTGKLERVGWLECVGQGLIGQRLAPGIQQDPVKGFWVRYLHQGLRGWHFDCRPRRGRWLRHRLVDGTGWSRVDLQERQRLFFSRGSLRRVDGLQPALSLLRAFVQTPQEKESAQNQGRRDPCLPCHWFPP